MNPILIVGAGPVGLTMACELARYGIPVRIIDRAVQRTDKSKALVVWTRTLELFDRSGGAVPFINAGFKVLGVNIITGKTVVGHVSMERVNSPNSFGLMLPQAETERLLEELRSPLDNDGIWLVRPDGYVACSSRKASTIGDYLDGLQKAKRGTEFECRNQIEI